MVARTGNQSRYFSSERKGIHYPNSQIFSWGSTSFRDSQIFPYYLSCISYIPSSQIFEGSYSPQGTFSLTRLGIGMRHDYTIEYWFLHERGVGAEGQLCSRLSRGRRKNTQATARISIPHSVTLLFQLRKDSSFPSFLRRARITSPLPFSWRAVKADPVMDVHSWIRYNARSGFPRIRTGDTRLKIWKKKSWKEPCHEAHDRSW